MATVFLTGGTGFLGGRLLHHLHAHGHRVVALHRPPTPPAHEHVNWIPGDLADRETFDAALAEVDTVIHAAAITGKARPADYRHINTEATRQLLEVCGEHNVPRFLFVSSVAAGFTHRFRYHYAQSKIAAESAVASSGLESLIVRPTMLMGPGSPVMKGLISLAGLPVIPLFGAARVDVQPIHVDDAALAIVSFLSQDFRGETVTLGGPEQLPLRELLSRLHADRRSTPARFLRIPWWLALSGATVAEILARAITPVTAGQLATFRNDGIAPDHRLTRDLSIKMRDIDAMIADSRST